MFKIVGNTKLQAMQLPKLLRVLGTTAPAPQLQSLQTGQSERIAIGQGITVRIVRV